MALLETAMDDCLAGRCAGMIHILISVADGFVNDFETNPRKGLHAREGDDMTAWDSIISHHKGLAHVHETVFHKPFKKLHAIEVFDLYRHGIVHGMVTNYANEVVATKAWNYLFAVADWATARERAAKEPEPEPSLGELFRETAKLGAEKKALAAWEKREIAASEEGFGAEEVVRTCRDFLQLWLKCNYGGMARLLGFPGSAGSRCKPGDVKDLYKGFRLTAFELRRVRVEAAAVAKVDLDLEVGGSGDDRGCRRRVGWGELLGECEEFLGVVGRAPVPSLRRVRLDGAVARFRSQQPVHPTQVVRQGAIVHAVGAHAVGPPGDLRLGEQLVDVAGAGGRDVREETTHRAQHRGGPHLRRRCGRSGQLQQPRSGELPPGRVERPRAEGGELLLHHLGEVGGRWVVVVGIHADHGPLTRQTRTGPAPTDSASKADPACERFARRSARSRYP